MPVIISNFAGDPNIGLYSLATDEYCLVPPFLKTWVEKEISKSLEVKTIRASIAGTGLLGVFAAGNSNGLIVSELIRKHEKDFLEKHFNVMVLKGKYTATGNIILANDKGCIISENIKKHAGDISDFLNVGVAIHDVGNLEIVGSIALTTNKGCLVGKFASKSDMEIIEKALQVKPEFATVNFGSSFVKSGVIANSKGCVLGDHTTGPEMQNIVEILGF